MVNKSSLCVFLYEQNEVFSNRNKFTAFRQYEQTIFNLFFNKSDFLNNLLFFRTPLCGVLKRALGGVE